MQDGGRSSLGLRRAVRYRLAFMFVLGASLVLCDSERGKRQGGFVLVLRAGLWAIEEEKASMEGFLVDVERGEAQLVWDEGEEAFSSCCCTYDHIIVGAGYLSLVSVRIALPLLGG